MLPSLWPQFQVSGAQGREVSEWTVVRCICVLAQREISCVNPQREPETTTSAHNVILNLPVVSGKDLCQSDDSE